MTNGQNDPHLYPSQKLAAKIAAKTLHADLAQAAIAIRLDQLIDRLPTAALSRRQRPMVIRQILDKILGSLFSQILLPAQTPIKGLYIHGGVGRGKTMLMDMFHDSVFAQGLDRPNRPAIWRLHFHDFMVLAQDVIHQARSKGADDPIEMAAADLARRGAVICFDEMEVRDIADAMIIKRLFDALWARGMILVTTSNRLPEGLYLNGLHRDRFLPFIASLKQRMNIHHIGEGVDWRSRVLQTVSSWHVLAAPASQQDKGALDMQLDSLFVRLSDDAPLLEEVIMVAGRSLTFRKVAGDLVDVHFDDMCRTTLGARDYFCLLYTSPSPRDRSLSRMPSSA